MFEISLWLFLLALGLALLGGAGVTGLVVAVRLFGRDDLEERRPRPLPERHPSLREDGPWRAEDSAPLRRDRLDDWPAEVEEEWPDELRDPVAVGGGDCGCGCHEAAARVGLHEAGARPPAPPPNGSHHLGTMGSLRPPPQPVMAAGAAVFGHPGTRQPPVPAGMWQP